MERCTLWLLGLVVLAGLLALPPMVEMQAPMVRLQPLPVSPCIVVKAVTAGCPLTRVDSIRTTHLMVGVGQAARVVQPLLRVTMVTQDITVTVMVLVVAVVQVQVHPLVHRWLVVRVGTDLVDLF